MGTGLIQLRLLALRANTLLRLTKSLTGKKSADNDSIKEQRVQKSESPITEKISSKVQIGKTSSPKNMSDLDSAMKRSGLSKVSLTDQQKRTLLEKGKVAINGGKQIIQKVSTPAGYAYRAYDMATNMTRQSLAEL